MHLTPNGCVVPRFEMSSHPPKYSGGLRFQTARRLAIERDLQFLRLLLEVDSKNCTFLNWKLLGTIVYKILVSG